MFSKDHLYKIIKLNDEYMSANSIRRKEIEQEIVDLVPEDLKDKSNKVNKQIVDLHCKMKEDLEKTLKSCSTPDWNPYLDRLQEVQEEILIATKSLGVDLVGTDLDKIRLLLEAKTSENK